MLQGLEAKGSDRLWRAYRSVLKGRVHVLPVDIRVAEQYAHVQAASTRAGRTRPAFDLLIAATALVHELTHGRRSPQRRQRDHRTCFDGRAPADGAERARSRGLDQRGVVALKIGPEVPWSRFPIA